MVRHRDDAGDLTQDVIVKMIESLGSYNGQSKLSTWVIRIAMNCCLSHMRRQRVRRHEPLTEVIVEHGPGHHPTVDRTEQIGSAGGRGGSGARGGGRELLPAERIEQSQQRQSLLRALESLDDESRAVLVLRDLQDLDYQQLSEVLEVPLGTVKSRLFRARAALRAAIEAQG